MLRQGSLAVELAPSLGAALLSFTFHDRDVLRPASVEDVAADPRHAACFPCVPWFGRLYGGLDFNERHWDLAPTLPACDAEHALHGEGWVRPWAVITHTDVFAECLFSSDGMQENRFPFPYEARQIVQLGDDALEIDLFLRNIGAEPMPAGLGLHPFFPRYGDTGMTFQASGLWTPGTKGRESEIPANLDFSKMTPLPERAIDHSFIRFAGNAVLSGSEIETTLETNAPVLHLYAPKRESYFCAEPVTHKPGAFGEEALEPGSVLHLSMRLAPREA